MSSLSMPPAIVLYQMVMVESRYALVGVAVSTGSRVSENLQRWKTNFREDTL